MARPWRGIAGIRCIYAALFLVRATCTWRCSSLLRSCPPPPPPSPISLPFTCMVLFLLRFYRKYRGLCTLGGRLLNDFVLVFFSHRGCQDADMCQDADPCAKVVLNNLVLSYMLVHTPVRLMTPIRAVLNKTTAAVWGILNANHCAKTPVCDPE